jgi:hypothetical protein
MHLHSVPDFAAGSKRDASSADSGHLGETRNQHAGIAHRPTAFEIALEPSRIGHCARRPAGYRRPPARTHEIVQAAVDLGFDPFA